MFRLPTRRRLLASVAAVAFAPQLRGSGRAFAPGEPPMASFIGDAMIRGHRTRGVDPTKLPVDREAKVDALVVGAGFGGLAAADGLRRRGVEDFVVVELEDVVGGLAQRRTLGGTTAAFGPRAFDAPVSGAAEAGDAYAAFVAAHLAETKARPARVRRASGGGWTYEDAGGAGAALVSAAERAVGAAGASAALDAVDAEAWAVSVALPEAPRERMRLYCRARFGLRGEFVSAAVLLEDLLRRGPRCGGLRLFPAGGVGAVAERLGAACGDRLWRARVALRVVRDGDGALAYVIDPATNYVSLVRARTVVVAIPPFVAREVVPDLAADGRFADLPDTGAWLEAAIGVAAPPAGFDVDADLHAPSGAHASALQALYRRDDGGGGPPDRLRPPYVLLDLRPFPGLSAAPARNLFAQSTPFELRDFVLREQARLWPDLAAKTTKVDLLRVAHAALRPAPGARTRIGPRLSRHAPPFFPAGADWTGAPSLEAAIRSGAEAADAVARFLRSPTTRTTESRPR
jgi:hypothetical protein